MVYFFLFRCWTLARSFNFGIEHDPVNLLQLQSHANVDTEQNPRRSLLKQLCSIVTLSNFNQGNMRVNNLGGMGPGGGPPRIYYANVGNLQGHSIDCVVTTVGNNYDSDNAN